MKFMLLTQGSHLSNRQSPVISRNYIQRVKLQNLHRERRPRIPYPLPAPPLQVPTSFKMPILLQIRLEILLVAFVFIKIYRFASLLVHRGVLLYCTSRSHTMTNYIIRINVLWQYVVCVSPNATDQE